MVDSLPLIFWYFVHLEQVYKGKSELDATNYRPVVLTSHIIKSFERVVQKNQVHHFEQTNAFNDSQQGFRKSKSRLSQLLAHHNDVLENLEKPSNADGIYLDFAKAFDKVDVNVPLLKLKNIGVKGKLQNWIKSFITERRQSVVVETLNPKQLT